MEEKPGFGFRPNDEELVGYYLRHKILGNHSLVDEVIREIKICSLDPPDLRFQSKIKSRDLVWYFFSRRENNNNNNEGKQSRTTPSGFWKLTGKSVNVNDRWGHLSGFRGTIGCKRVLTFMKGTSTSSSSSSRSEWVMHELHYTHTDLPEHKRTSYVICRLEYKGDDVNILSSVPTPTMANSASSVVTSHVDQSFQGNSGYYNTLSGYDSAYQFNGNYDSQPFFQGYSEYFNPTTSEYGLANQSHWFSNVQQQQVPYSAPYQDDDDMLKQVVEENWPFLIDERTCLREDSSHHRPKRPVTGVFPDYSSDSDTDSMVGRDDAWSSTDSVGSKDVTYHTPKYDTPSLSTVEPLHNHEAQEQPKQLLELPLQLQGKERKSECEWKMAEDSIKKAPSTSAVKQSWIVLEEMSWRNSRWVHLNNMLVGLLLFIFIIGWIILVG